MKPRSPGLAFALFISFLLLGTPGHSFEAWNVADTGIFAVLDNIETPAEADNPSENTGVSSAETSYDASPEPGTDNDEEPAPATDNAEFSAQDALPASETDSGEVPADTDTLASENATSSEEDDDYDFREPNFGEEPTPDIKIADPIEPLNRAFFVFNDKLYYWFAKPVAQGYSYVVNEDIRVSVRHFFSNIATPVRVVNTLLQGNILATGTELLRLVMNSTMGLLGFFDVAKDFGIEKTNADFGQTLGKYGIGNGMYFVLPVLGPTTLRDGIGSIGDAFLDPVMYITPWEASAGVNFYRTENSISLRIDTYEELTGAALDPYIAVKDAYIHNRLKAIRGRPVSD